MTRTDERDVEARQRELCRRLGAPFDPPTPRSKVGIALRSQGRLPLHAWRHPAEHGTCGWYVCWGDPEPDPHFFDPLCVEHVGDHVPELLPFLALPPGWCVQLAPGHEDVWYDAKVLQLDDGASSPAPPPSARALFRAWIDRLRHSIPLLPRRRDPGRTP